MKTLDRLNLSDVTRYGCVRRWYGFRHDDYVFWSALPRVSPPADFQVVVHAKVMDDAYIRASLAARYGKLASCRT